jgi:hypothetical protein
MSTTNTWKIAQLERETADGYVFTAHYTVEALMAPTALEPMVLLVLRSPETLVPFADLTEEVVIGWVKEKQLVVLRKLLKLKQHCRHNLTNKQHLLKHPVPLGNYYDHPYPSNPVQLSEL